MVFTHITTALSGSVMGLLKSAVPGLSGGGDKEPVLAIEDNSGDETWEGDLHAPSEHALAVAPPMAVSRFQGAALEVVDALLTRQLPHLYQHMSLAMAMLLEAGRKATFYARMWRVPLTVGRGVGSVLINRILRGPKRDTWNLTLEIAIESLRSASAGLPRGLEFACLRLLLEDPLEMPWVSYHLEHVTIEDGALKVRAEWQQHNNVKDPELVVLYLHGGAYCLMSPKSHRPITLEISDHLNAKILSVDYRRAPEHPYPAALDDSVAAYRWLISKDGPNIRPDRIVVMGDSAGGGLAMATLLAIRDQGLPAPLTAVLMSPWVDLTCSMDSWAHNEAYDYLNEPHKGRAMSILYAGGEHMLTNPYVSPLFADLDNLPPFHVQVGDAEALRDEGLALVGKACKAGTKATVQVYADMVHVFQGMGGDMAQRAFHDMADYVLHRHHCDVYRRHSTTVTKHVTPSWLDGEDLAFYLAGDNQSDVFEAKNTQMPVDHEIQPTPA